MPVLAAASRLVCDGCAQLARKQAAATPKAGLRHLGIGNIPALNSSNMAARKRLLFDSEFIAYMENLNFRLPPSL
jgi:hypothetical protein